MVQQEHDLSRGDIVDNMARTILTPTSGMYQISCSASTCWLGKGFLQCAKVVLHPRSYKSYADDLKQLADSLGVRQFFVIGVSGGGPYTYAAAALLPERVLGVMTISTLAQAGAQTEFIISSCQAPLG